MTQENKSWHVDSYSNIKCVTNTRIAAYATEMLAEMEKLAQALEDTGFEPDQSFYDVIKRARGM